MEPGGNPSDGFSNGHVLLETEKQLRLLVGGIMVLFVTGLNSRNGIVGEEQTLFL